MREKLTKRVNALDVLIILLIAAAIAAFCMRGSIRRIFVQEGDRVITYSFRITNVEEVTADSLQIGTELRATNGIPMGTVLSYSESDATDARELPDGRIVNVPNGKVNLSGTVSAKGYVASGFVYLNGGIRLLPGERITVTTVDAIFTLQLTAVQATEEKQPNRSN